jgi:hypothetical protein
MAINTGLDRDVFSLDMETILNSTQLTSKNITFFDYLSKILHWNPIILKNLVGKDGDNNVGYQEKNELQMIEISMMIAASCACVFAELWLNHFFPNETNVSNTLKNILNELIALTEEENRAITTMITDNSKEI